ncbi:glutaminyl-peptide cyclotransferase [Ekhidna sp.]
MLLLISCGDSKDEAKSPTSPRIRKATNIESPTQNQNFTRGNQISISVKTADDFVVDSVQVSVDEQVNSFTGVNFQFSLESRKVGTHRLLIKVFGSGKSETHYRKVIILSETAPEELTYEIQNTYPHDTEDYTQGLLIKDDFLYESTGQKGRSTFKKKDLKTGETLKVVNLSSDFFGEGLSLINDEFYQLTWTAGQGFVYDMNMEQVRTFNYQVEGWGLATLNSELVLTDETEKIYFVDPASFTIQRELQVYDNTGKIDALNELEVIDGLIYANVYQEDYIVVIDPDTGEVLQKIDLSGMLSESDSDGVDVLNGIAQDPETGRIYVTGKLWPKLFEVTFQPKTI